MGIATQTCLSATSPISPYWPKASNWPSSLSTAVWSGLASLPAREKVQMLGQDSNQRPHLVKCHFLETPEDGTVGQSVAIANYMAAKANTQGATPAEFAMSQMCMAEGEDLYSIMGSKNLQRWKAAADRCSDE